MRHDKAKCDEQTSNDAKNSSRRNDMPPIIDVPGFFPLRKAPLSLVLAVLSSCA